MRIFIWILIIVFIWILLLPVNEGFKKPKIKNIKKTITKTANKVGGTIAKVATVGLPASAKSVKKSGKNKRICSVFY
jgi:hypothetical protein